MNSTSFARPALGDLPHGLRILSHELRELWRLELQRANPTQAAGSLPRYMQATHETVFAARDRVKFFENSLGRPISSWLEEAAGMLEATYGARETWRQDDSFTPAYSSWRAETDAIARGLQSAFELDPIQSIPPGSDWESACRACSNLDFDYRAADRLMQTVGEGSLPDGTRVTRDVHRNALAVQVLDQQGNLLAGADSLDKAIESAIRVHCTLRPAHEITPEQFLGITTQVRVDVGRGKSGQAKTGPARLLYRDHEDQQALKNAMSLAYERGLVSGAIDLPADHSPFEAAAHRQEWINGACRDVMASAFETNAKSVFVPGAGHVLMVKGPEVSEGMVRSIHQHLVQEAHAEAEDHLPEIVSRDRHAMR